MNPGDGYRLLKDGEPVMGYDSYTPNGGKTWEPTGPLDSFCSRTCFPVRRRIEFENPERLTIEYMTTHPLYTEWLEKMKNSNDKFTIRQHIAAFASFVCEKEEAGK